LAAVEQRRIFAESPLSKKILRRRWPKLSSAFNTRQLRGELFDPASVLYPLAAINIRPELLDLRAQIQSPI
jgi:hypothetical protein